MAPAQKQRVQVAHCGELISPTLTVGPSFDVEVHLHRGRRNRLDFRLDGGKLVAVLGQAGP